MPAYFPEPYDDELLYSLLGRYHRHVGSGSPKQTLDDLFGSRCVIAGLDLQGHLGSLSAHLPPGWGMTPERLAMEFTLLPYYLAFHSGKVQERVRRVITNGSIAGLHLILGLAPAKSRVKNLRFCPDCLREMERRHSELYWRRSHQLPGVLLCLEHGCILHESGVPPLLGNRHAFIAATGENCSPGRPIALASLASHQALRSVARACQDVLQSPAPPRDRNDWVTSYRNRLTLAGLASAAGRARQEAIEKELQRHFGAVLEPLLAEVGASNLAWLHTITRGRHRALHPVFHILFQDFLEQLELDQPFGKGPWQCLNPLNHHQGEPLIDKVDIHHNHGRVVGVFECNCGFAYTRNITPESGIVSRARTLRFGEAFDQRLRQVVGEHAGLREMARRLHVDARTVRLRAAKLGLETVWKPARLPTPVTANPGKHRRAWRTLVCRQTAAGRKELARLAPALHAWLYRHDKEWLAAHQPVTKRRAHPVGHDWGSLDEQWARRVANLAEAIRIELPPRKVTLAEISRRTEEPAWLPNHLRHLPKTQACLRALRDTNASYQSRRITWVAQQLVASRLPLVEWRIRRMAGLGKRSAPEIDAALARVLSHMETTS